MTTLNSTSTLTTPMTNFYNIVPGTDILHSTTDVYELCDEAEGMTYRVELQADNGGVYIKSSEKAHEEGAKNIAEDMSISNKQLAIVVAKRILEVYGVGEHQ
jgi:hypothetical protein